MLQRRTATLASSVWGAVDTHGTNVYLVDLKGWEGAVATTGTVQQRSADHGGWPEDAHLTPRVIEATLLLVGTDFATVSTSLRDLTAAVPINALAALVVDDHGQQLTSQVRQQGDILAEQRAHQARVSIPLIAPDPRRYDVAEQTATTGLPASTGGLRVDSAAGLRVASAGGVRVAATVAAGTLTVVNDGNMDTPPRLVVSGPCPPFTVTHRGTGRTLRYHEAVSAGRTVVLDAAARTARLDGVAARYVSGRWFDYPPGTSEVAFNADGYDAGALLTSTHRSAWK